MLYQITIDLPAKLKELRDNIASQRHAESIVAAEMFAARANKNIDEIEAAMTIVDSIGVLVFRSHMEQKMSDISEDHFCASWYIGTENALWDAAKQYPKPYLWGFAEIAPDRIKELIALSSFLGEWYDGDNWVPIEAWGKVHGSLTR